MDDKIFELIEKMYADLSGKIDGIGNELQEVKTEVKEVKKQVTTIEIEHGNKLEALFDGYKQNAEILDRIEKVGEI